VRKWLWANESQDKRAAAAYIRGNAELTSLHLMCKLSDPPSDLVNDIAEAAPEVASFADTHGWLPLHHACANGASTAVLEILIKAYPEGKLIQDNQNRTPLHFYATCNTDKPEIMTKKVRILCDNGAAELADRGGMLPMHYAAAYGTNADVLKVLADAFPESLSTKDNKGKTPMHLTMVNAHRDSSPEVLKFLLDTAGRETINLRDTDGNLPLHLLNLGLRGVDLDSEQEKLTHVSECLRIYLSAKPRATADFLAEIQNLPDELQDVAVVSTHVRTILNKKIVRRFPTSVVMLDLYMYILLIFAFEVASTYHIKVRFRRFDPTAETLAPFMAESLAPSDTLAPSEAPSLAPSEAWEYDGETSLQILCRFGLFVGSGYFLLRELTQLAALVGLGLGLGSWVYDTTNWLDVVVISMVGTFAALMSDPNEYEAAATLDGPWGLHAKSFRAGCAFTKMILWVAVVYFLKSLSINFAVFLDGVVYVVKRLVAFLMAVACILVAFALMFAILYQEEELCNRVLAKSANEENNMTCEDPTFPHCTIDRSLLKVSSFCLFATLTRGKFSVAYVCVSFNLRCTP
jgi:ankyrin repeat protein